MTETIIIYRADQIHWTLEPHMIGPLSEDWKPQTVVDWMEQVLRHILCTQQTFLH
jgi:hypothetical protein